MIDRRLSGTAALVANPSTVDRAQRRAASARWPRRGRCRGRSAWRSSDRSASVIWSPSRTPVSMRSLAGSRQRKPRQRARRRQEHSSPGSRHRAAFDGVAARPDRAPGVSAERSSPRGEADLQRHEVEAGHHLGHRMLDLDARVHLEEVELAGVGIDDELDGAGAAIALLRWPAPRRPRPSRARGRVGEAGRRGSPR